MTAATVTGRLFELELLSQSTTLDVSGTPPFLSAFNFISGKCHQILRQPIFRIVYAPLYPYANKRQQHAKKKKEKKYIKWRLAATTTSFECWPRVDFCERCDNIYNVLLIEFNASCVSVSVCGCGCVGVGTLSPRRVCLIRQQKLIQIINGRFASIER